MIHKSNINIVFLFFIVRAALISGQTTYSISNGVNIPASDTLRALVIFAEIDFADGQCPGKMPENMPGNWGHNMNGKTLLPEIASRFLDPEVPLDGQFNGTISKYYHEASFGNYVIIGDYIPEVIRVPCSKARAGDTHVGILFSIMDTLFKDTTIYTKNGYQLQQFDNWTLGQQGLPKIKKPDGYIDLVYVIWRNNRFLSGLNTGDNSGYGINNISTGKLKNTKGTQIITSFNNSSGGDGGFHITIAEHLHGIFGGNNWHSGGGRGVHTFIATPFNYSCTGQLVATMYAVCGWDRWMMKWQNPNKKHLVSAYNEQFQEVNTEGYSVKSNPTGGIYYLRDHVSTGDAIQIKLPHLNWQKDGDIKNQYLWIEYRALRTKFDSYYVEACADNDDGKYPNGVPGIYCYIQVGKDIRDGNKDIYSSSISHPNGLASWLLPFTAEGNFDFNYRFDKVSEGGGWCGSWNNRSIPIEKATSLENPFTGYSDLFSFIDSNQDGKLYNGDNYQPGLSEVVNDSLIWPYQQGGDYEDAYSLSTNKTRISIATNPAPVPVYTHASDFEYKKFYFQAGSLTSSFENRTIHLNGLSIELLSEHEKMKGEDAIKVRIRWDDYLVDNNVRWCGNIWLHPNVQDSLIPSLVLEKGKSILLDRSLTPTQIAAFPTADSSQLWLSDTTFFQALPGSVMMLKPHSKIILDNGSRLILNNGSTLIMGKKSRIIVKDGAILVQMPGSKIIRNIGSRIIDN